MELSRIAWLVTVGACSIAALILLLSGYDGYAGVALAVGRRLGEQAGGLVDDQDVRVLVQDPEPAGDLARLGPVGEERDRGVVGDLAAGAETLRRAGFGVEANGDRLRVEVATERAELVTRALVADGLYPTELRPEEASLEDAFFALTEQPGEDGA